MMVETQVSVDDLERRFQQRLASGLLRPLDVGFARWLERCDSSGDSSLRLAAWLLSRQIGTGDVCIDLTEWAGCELTELDWPAPALATWVAALESSSVVGRPGQFAPLILEQGRRLYLYRHQQAETRLAAQLSARAARSVNVDRGRLAGRIEDLFGPAFDSGAVDWQRVAAAVAVVRRLSVISGGPGTGKTRTVAMILALLLDPVAGRNGDAGCEPRIALAAPTGKAAARLTESIGAACARLPGTAATALAQLKAVTLHRLLGMRPGRSGCRHSADNPLHPDVLVLDEASMVDLSMMALVLNALPDTARLILLGDRDQLASVEAGSVLGDICGKGRTLPVSTGQARLLADLGMPALAVSEQGWAPIADSITVLQHSYRFDSDSGIGALAAAIKANDAERAAALLDDPGYTDIAWYSPTLASLEAFIVERVVEQWRACLSAGDPASVLAALARFRVLCAVRKGPWGVEQFNLRIERVLAAAGVIGAERPWYAGRPLLITRNDPSTRLQNGDVGVLLPDVDVDPVNPPLMAWFESPDRGMLSLPPARLPPCESVYAMTVHKSQGSEFDQVLLVLPVEDAPVLSRELIYTAVTRARSSVEIWSAPAIMQRAMARQVERSGGLLDKLWSVAD